MAAFEDPRESGFDPELVKTALMSREQFTSKPRKLILGIDMGIADIGICLMDELNQEIVLMATHLFDCPRNPKDHTSLATARRQARSQRRNIARRAARKKHIRKILMAYGIIPDGTAAEWFSVREGDQDNIQLRVKGLSEVLTNRELARVLYGFASRRGYIDHGKADNDKDDGKVKKALKANAEVMEAYGYETFAQYLITQPRIRNRQDDYTHCVDIDMVVDEVHAIFRHQRELGDEQTLFLKPGDVLAQDGLVGRLHSYDISVNTVKMYYARGEISFQKTGPLAAERFPTLSKWNDGLKIMQEDCLGLCWLEFLTDRAASC